MLRLHGGVKDAQATRVVVYMMCARRAITAKDSDMSAVTYRSGILRKIQIPGSETKNY